MSRWHRPTRPSDNAWVKTDLGWRSTVRRVAGNLVVPPGEVWVLDGVTVQGTVTVERGAALQATNVVISGRVECSIDSTVTLTSSTVNGSLLSSPRMCQPTPEQRDTRRALDNQVPGQVRLNATTVHADIRCVARSDADGPRPQLMLAGGTIVRGCVLVAGVDVVAEDATVQGHIWRTDADHVDRGTTDEPTDDFPRTIDSGPFGYDLPTTRPSLMAKLADVR